MIELFIYFGISAWIIHLITQKYEKKILVASSLQESLTYRKKIKWIKLSLSIIFLAIYVIGASILNTSLHNLSLEDYWLSGNGKNVIALLFLYLINQKGWLKLKGNVTTSTKNDYIKKNERFVLYLRGFEQDRYIDSNIVYEKKFSEFSEYFFAEEIKQHFPICAVGMTKESDAPWGADRIYLDDASWRDDVLELMERTQYIFILLNDRESCIWEISQSAQFLEKTFFIVNDFSKYEAVRAQVSQQLVLPDLRNRDMNFPFYLRFVDEPIVVQKDSHNEKDRVVAVLTEFENSKRGYKELVNMIFEPEKETWAGCFMNIGRTVLGVCILLILSIMNIVIVNYFSKTYQTFESYWVGSFLIGLYIIEGAIYLIFKKIRKSH